MKKLGLLVMPLMVVSLLASCRENSSITHKFTFYGTNCKINGDSKYSHDIYENDKNVKYTITPDTGYKLPETIDSDISYDNKTGVITISEIKTDIELSVEAEPLPPIPGLKHKIYLDAGGGQFGEDQPSIIEDVSDGDTILTKPILVREGYDVDKVTWLINDTTDEFIFGPKGVGTEVREDYFLHAKWGDVSSYSITIQGDHIVTSSVTFNHNDFRPIYKIIKEESGYGLINDYVIVNPKEAADAYYSDKHTLQILPSKNEDNIVITLRAEKEPERDYFDVSTSGEHIRYFKDIDMTLPLESVKAKKGEDFIFYMFGEEEVPENSEGYIPPTSLDVKIGYTSEDDSYSIEEVTGQYANLMKKVTIDGNYVTGDIDIHGDGVKKDYYQINFPYLFGLKRPEIQDSFFEYGKDATFEFIAENSNAINDDLLTAINILVNLDGSGNNWINPGAYDSGDNVTFEHDTVNNKYYLHIKANTVSTDKNVINVSARAKNVSVLNSLNWEEINRCSSKGFAAMLFDVGDTKLVEVEGVTYQVRIIALGYDDLADGNGKAGITFEFVNVIANFVTKWNASYPESYNYDFVNCSDLGNCLKPDHAIYNIIPSDLMSVIKLVKKKADIYNKNEAKWEENEYATQLFPLSVDEIDGNDDGTYEFYKKDSKNKRKKNDQYWLRSPYTGGSNAAFVVMSGSKVGGEIKSYDIVNSNSRYVAPAFCI